MIWHPDETVSGLLSLSDSAPTMPSGYTKKRLIGAIYNDSGGDIYPFNTIGLSNHRELFFSPPIQVLNSGAETSWTDVDFSGFAPTLAEKLILMMSSWSLTDNWKAQLRPNGITTSMHRWNFNRDVGEYELYTSDQIIEYLNEGDGSAVTSLWLSGYSFSL